MPVKLASVAEFKTWSRGRVVNTRHAFHTVSWIGNWPVHLFEPLHEYTSSEC